MWHPGRVDVIGFVLCCRSDRGKIDRGAIECVYVCVRVCVYGKGLQVVVVVGVLERGQDGKVRL